MNVEHRTFNAEGERKNGRIIGWSLEFRCAGESGELAVPAERLSVFQLLPAGVGQIQGDVWNKC